MVKIREIDLYDLSPALRKAVKRTLEPTTAVAISGGGKETHIGIALDASGSMSSIASEIMGAFNSTVDQLVADQDKLGDVYVTFVTFGEGQGVVIEKYRHQPIGKLKKLTSATYQPSGMTPFYDGLGRLLTILETHDQQDGVDRAFLVNVFTDGLENQSVEWKREALRDKIIALQAKGNWTITYAGANVNLDQIATETGIRRGSMQGFAGTSMGTTVLTNQHVNSTASYSASRGAGMKSVADFYSGKSAQKPTADWRQKAQANTYRLKEIVPPDKDEDDDNQLV